MTAQKIRDYLLQQRNSEGFFVSQLSDSAVSTATACVALEIADAKKYSEEIQRARAWLITHHDASGLYGDSAESPANLTATFLTFVALSRDEQYHRELANTRNWLLQHFENFGFPAIKKGILEEYGEESDFLSANTRTDYSRRIFPRRRFILAKYATLPI